MMRADGELDELFAEFFAAEVTAESVEAIERSQQWPEELWGRAAATQLPWIGLAEEHGGVGGSLADVAAMIQHAAYCACPLPLIEHHVAAHAAAMAGIDLEPAPLSLAGLGDDDLPTARAAGMSGRLSAVPWAADVSSLVVLTRDEAGRDVVAVVESSGLEYVPAVDLAGMPSPDVVLAETPARVGLLPRRDRVVRRAEVLRCAALAGLQRRLYDLTAEYVSQRHQFGKPVGSFQSVQVHTVTLAQCASMSMVAVDRAVSAVAAGEGELEALAAMAVVTQNAVKAVASAHQAHGAIGMTREYPLQLLTRRMHALRQPWRSQATAPERLGDLAAAAPSLSALIASHPQEDDGHE